MMNQQVVESVLGRLITDGDFRRSFFRSPVEACRSVAQELNEIEIDALSQLDPIALEAFSGCLDPTIVRAAGTLLGDARAVRTRR